MSAKKIVKVNIMGRSCHVMYVTNMLAKYNSESEYYGGDLVTLLTCQQKIIVKVNIMGENLSRDVTLLTCRQKK